jgi:hypothetical protein
MSSRLKLLGRAKSAIGPMMRPINNWFQKNPTGLAAAASKLGFPASASRSTILKSIKSNPISSLLIMMEVSDLSGLTDMVFAKRPHLRAFVEASVEADDIDSLTSDREAIDDKRKEIAVANSQKIDDLTLANIEEFKDERDLITRVLGRMPGHTHDARLVQLLEFKKVMNMAGSNFTLYERIRNLEV